MFYKDKLHVFKYSISNVEWALRSEYNYPFPMERMKTQSILSSKDIQINMWFFGGEGVGIELKSQALIH